MAKNWRETKRTEILEKTGKAHAFAAQLTGRDQSELKSVAGEVFNAWCFGSEIELDEAMVELVDLMAYYGQSL